MKKRILALSLCFVMLFSLCSCKADNSVMTVSDTEIPSGVFAYYLNEVMSAPEKYDVTDNDRQTIIEKAELLCKGYAVTALFMNERKVTLGTGNKQSVATRTETLWNLYSDYYKSIGIDKTDITKVITHEERKLSLLEYYFGEKGLKPVSEDELKEEFVDIYVGFKAVEGSLTKTNDAGETVEMTEKEKAALKKRFSTYAQRINDGEITIDEANVAYNSSLGLIVTGDVESSIVRSGDPMFAEDFFDKVNSMSHTKAAVIESGTKIYLVQRERIATDEGDAFFTYRTEVLKQMKMASVENKIKALADKAEADVKRRKLEKIYDILEEARAVGEPTEQAAAEAETTIAESVTTEITEDKTTEA